METNLFMQGVSGLLVLSALAALFVGAAISFVMKCSAGPHQEPFWLAAVISAGSGATISSVANVLAETHGCSLWSAMAIGAACGILGAWGALHFGSLREKTSSPTRNSGGQNRTAFRSAREPWRVPRAGCRAVFSTPDFQKRKLSDRGQEAAQQ
jgi:hypothetical protein